MSKYFVISERYENDNTAEFGYGDYPRRTPYIAMSVEAETKRKAQNKAKKINPKLRFSGMFGDRIYIDSDLPDYLKKNEHEWWYKNIDAFYS